MRCLYCEPNFKGWPDDQVGGLKYCLSNNDICDTHKPEALEKVKELERKVYILKKPEPFIPPMAKKLFTNRQEPREREPNNGELME